MNNNEKNPFIIYYSLLSALKTHFVNNALFIIVVLVVRSPFYLFGLPYLLNNVSVHYGIRLSAFNFCDNNAKS